MDICNCETKNIKNENSTHRIQRKHRKAINERIGDKKQRHIAANYGAEDIIPWVSPIDIAAAVAEELLASSIGRKVRYVANEELSGKETARVLGKAIGKL